MRKGFLFPLIVAVPLGLAVPAGAAGESSGGGSTAPPSKPPVAKTCKKGEVMKTVVKSGKKVPTCMKIKTGVLPDEELYDQGRALAKAGYYEWALSVLAAIHNQDDPRVLNYTGYSNRKAGRLELGISYYRKALAIDPNFVLAREYLGEGYVAAGRMELARVELQEIGARCGTTCPEYKQLSQAIETANP